MKHIYSLTAGLLAMAICPSAIAEISGVSVPGPYPHTPSQSSASNGSLQVNTRLVAKSYYIYQNGKFTPVDSFNYSYSNGRGGSPEEMDTNDDGVMFDQSVKYIYNGSTFVNKLKRTQSYGLNGVEMLYYMPWNASAQTPDWKDSIRYAYLYSGNQILHARLDTYIPPGWSYGNTYLYNNSYTGNGYIANILAVDQDINFVYDNNDNLVCRWIQARNPNSAQWIATIKDSFAYDNAGRLVYMLHQVYDIASSNWINDQQTFYTYAAGTGPKLSFSAVEQWNAAQSLWQKKEQHLFEYDVNNNKTADITQNWNAALAIYQNSTRIDWVYNYNHQITSVKSTTWSTTAAAWVAVAGNFQRNFYYETYFPTSILNLENAVVNMNLYPLPASDVVHFRIDWRMPQDFSMSVTDMQGRTLQQWSEPATGVYERSLDVTQWPAGNYLLTVNGEKGQLTKRFVVAR